MTLYLKDLLVRAKEAGADDWNAAVDIEITSEPLPWMTRILWKMVRPRICFYYKCGYMNLDGKFTSKCEFTAE